jgi:sugar phosphate permease
MTGQHHTLSLQVVIAYTLGIAAMLMAFAAVPASMGALQWATVFMIGFFLYGPQASMCVLGGAGGGAGASVRVCQRGGGAA